ncbi:MAG TPA: hypothetical protein PLJ78_10475 [Anaerolineae bacterium]|nr:hypothetical protein [Anaerolineae bacterium]HQK14353.1 hypothetical protein [Anaerolineae bacterium]
MKIRLNVETSEVIFIQPLANQWLMVPPLRLKDQQLVIGKSLCAPAALVLLSLFYIKKYGLQQTGLYHSRYSDFNQL